MDGIKKATDRKFPKRERLLKRGDFLRVQNSGTRGHTEHFVVLVTPGPGLGYHRLGITAGRRAGGSVRRNRIKRLIREYFRNNKEKIFTDLKPGGADIVVIIKPRCPDLSLDQVTGELNSWRPK